MTDVLVCAIPVLDLQYPPSSPAVIKACLQRNGYTARTVDFNLELFEICKQYGADHTESSCGGSEYFFLLQSQICIGIVAHYS